MLQKSSDLLQKNFFSSYLYNIKITIDVTKSEFVILHGCNADRRVTAVLVSMIQVCSGVNK